MDWLHLKLTCTMHVFHYILHKRNEIKSEFTSLESIVQERITACVTDIGFQRRAIYH